MKIFGDSKSNIRQSFDDCKEQKGHAAIDVKSTRLVEVTNILFFREEPDSSKTVDCQNLHFTLSPWRQWVNSCYCTIIAASFITSACTNVSPFTNCSVYIPSWPFLHFRLLTFTIRTYSIPINKMLTLIVSWLLSVGLSFKLSNTTTHTGLMKTHTLNR